MGTYRGKIILLMVLIAAAPLWLKAQPDTYMPGFAPGLPVRGYVVLDNGDTITGQVIWRFKYAEDNLTGIRFITDAGENFVFSASDIIGFGNEPLAWKKENPVARQIKVEDYLSIPSYRHHTQVFMHRLLDGHLSVFQDRKSSVIPLEWLKLNDRIEGENFSYSPVTGLTVGQGHSTPPSVVRYRSRYTSYFVRKNEGELLRVNKKNFPEMFETLFGDSPAIMSEVTKNPSLKDIKYFMILAEVYDRLTTKQ